MDVAEHLDNATSKQSERVEELLEFMEEIEDIERLQDLAEQNDCLHDALEESLPENQKYGAHMLSCPCPKCTPRC